MILVAQNGQSSIFFDTNEHMAEQLSGEISSRDLMASVARAYYLDNVSKVDIADRLAISRHKVTRLLAKAVDEGIVTITINDQGMTDPMLSERLAAHLGLRNCYVVRTGGDQDAVRDRLGRAAAGFLSDMLREGEILGLTWGRTLNAVAGHLSSLPRLTIVQLTGTLSGDLAASPIEIVRRASQYSRGAVYPIFSPMVVRDERTARILKNDPTIRKAIDLFPAVTTAVLSVGCWNPPDTQIRSALDEAEAKRITELGCVADIAGILVDAEGAPVDPAFQRRCVAISYEELNSIPRVIAVAAGRLKAPAIQAVSNAGIITDLITDDALALAILP